MKKIVLLGVLSLLFFTGCRVVGGGVRVNVGHDLPPAHAPAHGRRAHHMYHYYPDAEFYFDIHRNLYFYLDSRSHWKFSVNLPLHLRHHISNGYVEIEMEDDRPYIRHKHHRIKYKKNKKKYKRKFRAKKKHKIEGRKQYKKHENEERNQRKKHKRNKDDDDEDKHHRGRGQ